MYINIYHGHLFCSLKEVVFSFQVGIFIGTAILMPPRATFNMPVLTKKYVELQCDLHLLGMIIPLSYNLFLLLLCAVFGFLTRKVPENFNESWYIFICVWTTLFIWVAFLPTYFTAFYAYHQAALLALALFLNATIILLCFFSPKLYALYYVSEDDIKITNFSETSNSQRSTRSTRRGTVDTITNSVNDKSIGSLSDISYK